MFFIFFIVEASEMIINCYRACRWVVLDEVDRLLDMGFEQTILEVLSTIRGERLPGLKEKEVGAA